MLRLKTKRIVHFTVHWLLWRASWRLFSLVSGHFLLVRADFHDLPSVQNERNYCFLEGIQELRKLGYRDGTDNL